jgi:hypothetical protein
MGQWDNGTVGIYINEFSVLCSETLSHGCPIDRTGLIVAVLNQLKMGVLMGGWRRFPGVFAGEELAIGLVESGDLSRRSSHGAPSRLHLFSFSPVGAVIGNHEASTRRREFAPAEGVPRFSRRAPPRPPAGVLYRRSGSFRPRTDFYSPDPGVGV